MAVSALQWQFIAQRLVSTSDGEAARAVGINPGTVSAWKKESPEFVAEYTASFEDGVHVAKSLARKHLGLAMMTLVDGLSAKHLIGFTEGGTTALVRKRKGTKAVQRSDPPAEGGIGTIERDYALDDPPADEPDEPGKPIYEPDWRARNEAAKLLAQTHGLLKESQEHSGPNGAPIPIEHSGSVATRVDLGSLSGDELAALRAAVAKAKTVAEVAGEC